MSQWQEDQTMSELQGKTALVTGASKGIGAGIAKELAASGAAVVVNYATDRNGAEAAVTTITAVGGRAVAIPGDVNCPAKNPGELRQPGSHFQRRHSVRRVAGHG